MASKAHPQRAATEHERKMIELRAKAPMRPVNRPVADLTGLSLFEPTLF